METIWIPCVDHDIPVNLFLPKKEGPFPFVVMLHGLLSNKNGDGRFLGRGAEILVEKGFGCAVLDFCSLGENTYPRENYGLKVLMEEAGCVYETLKKYPYVDAERMAVLGHSLGGRVALLNSFLNPKCLVTLNGVVNVEEVYPLFSEELIHDMMEKGVCEVHTSDGRIEKIYRRFYDEYTSIFNHEIETYEGNLLVVLGKSDPTVNPDTSRNFLKKYSMIHATLLEIEDANHTFNAKTNDGTKVIEVFEKVGEYLKENL